MLKHPMSSRSHPNDIVAHIRDSALHDKIEPHDSITAPSSSQSISPMPSTSSSAATLQDEQQDIEADDYDYRSQNTSVLTSTECAATVIHNQQIALDTRLAIFTNNDTSEPRAVHLFPTTTCSCPTKSNCYHILTMSRWWPPVTLMTR